MSFYRATLRYFSAFAILIPLCLHSFYLEVETKSMTAYTKQGNLCRCLESDEARQISSSGKAHVHCDCLMCEGKAVYPMTAWRHLQRTRRARGETLDDQLVFPSTSSSDISDTCESDHLSSSGSVGEVFQASDSFCEFPSDTPSAMAGTPYESGEDEIENESTASEIPGDAESFMCMSSSDEDANMHSDDSCIYEDSERDPDEDDLDQDERLEQFVNDTVLRLVEIKGQAGFSQSIFEDLLIWGKDILNKANPDLRCMWPSDWGDVLVLLEKFGYKSPRLYWICLDDSHPYLFGLLTTRDELCPHCGHQGKIPYYYLSVIDKVKRWCSSPSMCQKMTAHWKEKSHWLPEERTEGWGWEPKKEFWDGTRFAELAYFWDPEVEWTLPVKCPVNGCGCVTSAETLLACPVLDGDLRQVECRNCHNTFQHAPKRVTGDPRNLAYDGKSIEISHRM